MVKWYQEQLNLAFYFISVLDKDLNRQHEYSKFLTTISKQIKKLQEFGINLNISKNLTKSINANLKLVEEKPFTITRFKELLKIIK